MAGRVVHGLPQGENVVLEEFQRVKPKPAKTKYMPPKAYVNMDVNWHIAADVTGMPSPAKCLAVNGETIDLVAFTKDGIRYIRGVRHVDDPRAINLSKGIQNKTGAWSAPETEDRKALQLALGALRVAEERIQVLEESIAAILGKSVEEWREDLGIPGKSLATPSSLNADGEVDEDEDDDGEPTPIPYAK